MGGGAVPNAEQPQPGQNVFQDVQIPDPKESLSTMEPDLEMEEMDRRAGEPAAAAQRGFRAEPGILPEVLEEDPAEAQETSLDGEGEGDEEYEGESYFGEDFKVPVAADEPLPTPEAQIEDADTKGPVSPVETETVAAEAEDVKTAAE